MELMNRVIENTTIIYIWGVSTKETIGLWLIQKKLPGCFMPFFEKIFKGLDKRVRNIRLLRIGLNECNETAFNTNHEHYLSYLDRIHLMDYPRLPQRIEEKLNRYNKKAADLSDLFLGCGHFVEDMIIKNSLEHLHGIDIVRDSNNHVIPWELGYEQDTRLSQVLAHELKDRILKNEKIEKTLFDNVDLRFSGKIAEKGCIDAFQYFLRDLNKEIEIQEKSGCLKLFKRYYGETKELVIDLLDEVNKYKI